MFIKVVILSKIKFPHLKVNSLLFVSNEIVDSHFVPKIPTLRRDFYLLDKLPKYPCAILELFRYSSGIVPQSGNSYFVQDNSGIVPILTLRRTNTLSLICIFTINHRPCAAPTFVHQLQICLNPPLLVIHEQM